MNLYSLHRRRLIWLHWVATSTAGAGTFMAVIDLAAVLIWPYYSAPYLRGFDPLAVALIAVLLNMLCVGTCAAIQQLILQRSGLSTWWLALSLAGIALGLFFGCLAAIVTLAIVEFLGLSEMQILVGSVFFGMIGATTGMFQGVTFPVGPRKRAAWIAVNALFPALVFWLSNAYFFEKLNMTQTGMSLGLLYGILTGTCLAWIAPTSAEAEAEQRYLKWLTARPLPQRIDWGFLS